MIAVARQPATPQGMLRVLRERGPFAAIRANLAAMTSDPIGYPISMGTFGLVDTRRAGQIIGRMGPQGAAVATGLDRAQQVQDRHLGRQQRLSHRKGRGRR